MEASMNTMPEVISPPSLACPLMALTAIHPPTISSPTPAPPAYINTSWPLSPPHCLVTVTSSSHPSQRRGRSQERREGRGHGAGAGAALDGDREPRRGAVGPGRRVADVLGARAPPAAGLPAVGEPQVRAPGVPLPHQPRRVPGHHPRHRAGVRRRARQPEPRRAVAQGLGGGHLRPRHRARLPRRPRLHHLRLHHVQAQARLPHRLRLLQAGRRAQSVQGGVHRPGAQVRQVRRGQPVVPVAAAGQVRHRRRVVHAALRLRAQHQLRHHEGGPRRGLHRHVRRPRRALRQVPRPPQGCRRAGRQLQPLQPDPVALGHDRQPLQDAREHPQLQPRRHGLQRGRHRHRPGPRHAAGQRRRARRRRQHGGRLLHLVPREAPVHADPQRILPRRVRRRAALQPAPRLPPRQVPAGARGAHAQGRRRPRLPVRVPGGGRAADQGPVHQPRPHGGGWARAQDQHHHPGAPRAALLGAAPLLRGRAVPPPVPVQDLDPAAGDHPGGRVGRGALHPGLQARVRALLHARGEPRRAGAPAEQPGAPRRRPGGLPRGAAPLRQHLQQQHLVRAGVPGGQGPGPPRRPRVAARLRVRVQVQQRRVACRPPRAPPVAQPLAGLHRPVPGAHGRLRYVK